MKKLVLAAALLLASCSMHVTSGPVLGVLLMYSEDGKLVGAEALGQSPDMASCRKTAAKLLGQKPLDPGMALACAQLEIQ